MRRTAFRRLQTNIPISWLLRDEFSDTRAAGAVNGTMPTPGPGGARDVTDTNSKLSIGDDYARFATGGVGNGDPGLWLDATPRVAGKIFAGHINISTTNVAFVAWDSNKTGAPTDGYRLTTSFVALDNGGASATLATLSTATDYSLFSILRAIGNQLFVAGGAFGTSPILLWMTAGNSSANLSPSTMVGGTTPVFTSKFMRVPSYLWLPTPLASDGFGSSFGTSDGLGHAEGVNGGIGSGGGNVTWTGSTWSVSGGQAINTPGVGSELLDDTGFDNSGAWGKDAAWSISGSKALLSLATGSALIWKSGVASTGNWYRFDITIDSISGSGQIRLGAGGAYARLLTGAGSYIQTVRASNSNDQAQIQALNAATLAAQLDNPSFRQLTLAHLFSSCLLSTADVFAGVDLVITAGTQAGIVLNLDSTSSPTNFVIAYHDGTNAKLEKCVAGTYTSVISAAATYSSGARLVVSKIGAAYRLYYNNALVGSGTISDSGIVNNTRHGLFSTYASNTMDNFTVYASGSGGEYNVLNRYVNL